MFGGHLPELLIVLVLALVVFGPKRLPEIGGAMGKGIREFRKSTTTDDSDHETPATPAPQIPPVTEVHTTVTPVKEPEAR